MDTPRVISSGFSVLFHNREAGPDDQVYEVEAISIDDAAQRLDVERIACIKMDIEGLSSSRSRAPSGCSLRAWWTACWWRPRT